MHPPWSHHNIVTFSMDFNGSTPPTPASLFPFFVLSRVRIHSNVQMSLFIYMRHWVVHIWPVETQNSLSASHIFCFPHKGPATHILILTFHFIHTEQEDIYSLPLGLCYIRINKNDDIYSTHAAYFTHDGKYPKIRQRTVETAETDKNDIRRRCHRMRRTSWYSLLLYKGKSSCHDIFHCDVVFFSLVCRICASAQINVFFILNKQYTVKIEVNNEGTDV